MRTKIIILILLAVAVVLTLGVQFSSKDSAKAPSPTPTSQTVGDLLKNAVSTDNPIRFGDWEITVGDINIDSNNSIPAEYSVDKPTAGLVYAYLPLRFSYVGSGDPTTEINQIELVLMNEAGEKFNSAVSDKVYAALGGGINASTLSTKGYASGSVVAQVDPNSKTFYLAIGNSNLQTMVVAKLDSQTQ